MQRHQRCIAERCVSCAAQLPGESDHDDYGRGLRGLRLSASGARPPTGHHTHHSMCSAALRLVAKVTRPGAPTSRLTTRIASHHASSSRHRAGQVKLARGMSSSERLRVLDAWTCSLQLSGELQEPVDLRCHAWRMSARQRRGSIDANAAYWVACFSLCFVLARPIGSGEGEALARPC